MSFAIRCRRCHSFFVQFVGDYTFTGEQNFEANNLFSIGNYDLESDSGSLASPLVIARAFEQVLGELDYIDRFAEFFLEGSTKIYQSLVGEGVEQPTALNTPDEATRTAEYVGNYILASQEPDVTSRAQFQPKLVSALLDGSFINPRVATPSFDNIDESSFDPLVERNARIDQFVETSRSAPVGIFERDRSLYEHFKVSDKSK